MKSNNLSVPISLIVLAASIFLPGCAQQQHIPEGKHISEAKYQEYIQKYPEMGEKVKKGSLTKDAAYSLRNIAPQMKIMNQFEDNVEAKSAEINARHIPKSEKHRLIMQYMKQNQQRYVDAANEAGKEAARSQSKN